MKNFEAIKATLDGMADDVEKAKGGNKSAITRVRHGAMAMKTAAHELRKEALSYKG